MPLAAVGQFCATASIVANKSICIDLIKKAARQGAAVSNNIPQMTAQLFSTNALDDIPS